MESVPMESVALIFNYLSFKERVHCEAVCQRWFNILQTLWKKKFAFRLMKTKRDVTVFAERQEEIEIASVHPDTERISFVDVEQCKEVETAFEYFIKRLPSLKYISFTKATSNKVWKRLMPLVNKCSNVEGLSFAYCKLESREAPLSSMLHLKNLKRLSLIQSKIPNFNFDADSANLSRLSHLELQDMTLEGDTLVGIFRTFGQHLEHVCLDVNMLFEIDAPGNEVGKTVGYFLDNYPKYVRESSVKFYDLIECLKQIPNVKYLSLHRGFFLPWLCPDEVPVDVLGLVIKGYQHLESLSLSHGNKNTNICLTLLPLILENSTLRYLNLSCANEVDSSIFEDLNKKAIRVDQLVVFAAGTTILNDEEAVDGSWRVIRDFWPKDEMFYGFRPAAKFTRYYTFNFMLGIRFKTSPIRRLQRFIRSWFSE